MTTDNHEEKSGYDLGQDNPIRIRVFRWDERVQRFRNTDDDITGPLYLCSDYELRHKFCKQVHDLKQREGFKVLAMRNQQPVRIEIRPGTAGFLETQIDIYCEPVRVQQWKQRPGAGKKWASASEDEKEATEDLYKPLDFDKEDK